MTIRCTSAAALVTMLMCVQAMVRGSEARTTLEQGSGLPVNDELELSGVYQFRMQGDCNLVLYHTDIGPLWASKTDGQGTDCHFEMQTDGNAVIYKSGMEFVWHTDTCCKNDGEHIIILQPDGNVVMRNAFGTEIWSTGTKGRLAAASVSGSAQKGDSAAAVDSHLP